MSDRIRIKRVYDPPEPDDGLRVLVDRLWPRGLTKSKAKVDVWLKEIAPSAELRRWFGHRPERWHEFQRKYAEELEGNPAVGDLRGIMARGPVSLLYAARDTARNDAVVLARYLSGGAASE